MGAALSLIVWGMAIGIGDVTAGLQKIINLCAIREVPLLEEEQHVMISVSGGDDMFSEVVCYRYNNQPSEGLCKKMAVGGTYTIS